MAFLTAFRQRLPVTQKLNGNPETVGKPKETKETGPKPWPKLTEAEAKRLVTNHLWVHGDVPQQWIAVRCGVTKGTVSKWLQRWEAEGAVRRVRVGRSNLVRRDFESLR